MADYQIQKVENYLDKGPFPKSKLSTKKVTKARYVIAHETGAPGNLKAQVGYQMNRTDGIYVTHYVGDGGKIVEITPPDGKLYIRGAGNINAYSYAQVELCRTTDKEQFKKDYEAYIWLLCSLAKAAGIDQTLDSPKGNTGIKTHDWARANYGGTTHGDPWGYLKDMGVSKDQFKEDIKNGKAGALGYGGGSGGGLTEEQKNAFILVKRNPIKEGSNNRSGEKMEAVKFIVMHSTHGHGTTAQEASKYYIDTASEKEAFHAIIDDNDTYELVPVTENPSDMPEKLYHVANKPDVDNNQFGGDANDIAIGVALCEPGDKKKNETAYDHFVQYIAYVCHLYKLDPSKSVVTHDYVQPKQAAKKEEPATTEGEAKDKKDKKEESAYEPATDFAKDLKDTYGKTLNELVKDVTKEKKKREKLGTYDKEGKVVFMDAADALTGENNTSTEAYDKENDGFSITVQMLPCDHPGVTITKKPFRETPAQPVYPDLLGNYKILSDKDAEDVAAASSKVADENGKEAPDYIAGAANYIDYGKMQNNGIQVARIFFNYEDYEEREQTTDLTEKRYKQKTPGAGQPVNLKQPFPIDEKIEELEQHVPFLKIHQLMYDNPSQHIVDLSCVVMDLADKTEKRLVQIENIQATTMRYLWRLAGRVNINCTYFGGHDVTRKYAGIRCLHQDRIEEGGRMTLDQCMNCTRFEPILGKSYDITDLTGQETQAILDDNLMSYSTMQEQVNFTRKETMPDKKDVRKISKTEIKQLNVRAETLKDFIDIWDDGYVQDWKPVPVEYQKPHVIYEDGTLTKTLESNYKNDPYNDPKGAGFTGIYKSYSGHGTYGGFGEDLGGSSSSGGGSGDGGDISLGEFGDLPFLETAKKHLEIFEKATDSEFVGFLTAAKKYANENYTKLQPSMEKYGYKDELLKKCKENGLDPIMMMAYIVTESGGDPNAGSNYKGLLQTQPDGNWGSMSAAQRAIWAIGKGTGVYMQKMATVKKAYGKNNWMMTCVVYNTGEKFIYPGGDENTTFDKIWKKTATDAQNYWPKQPRKFEEVAMHFPKIVYVYSLLLEKTDIGKQYQSASESSGITGKVEDLALTFPLPKDAIDKNDIKVISGYGIRSSADESKMISSEKGKAKKGEQMHHGVDIQVKEGASIIAAAAGKVVEVFNNSKNAGYGVRIKHDDKNYTSYYHMKEIPSVKKGDKVTAGQTIGKVGGTGSAKGSVHLHFEIWQGGDDKNLYSQDPGKWFPMLGKAYVSKSKTINSELKKAAKSDS